MNTNLIKVEHAELLSEMEALNIIGGTIGKGDGASPAFILAKCSTTNTYCTGANCVAGCGGNGT